MKLKEQTFAVIAEKQGSISHKWFDKNYGSGWGFIGNWYINLPNDNDFKIQSFSPKNIPLYTESEFEELIKQEESEHFDQVLQKGIDNSRLNKEESEALSGTRTGFISQTEESNNTSVIFPTYKTVVPANAGGIKETFMAEPSQITPLTLKDTQPPPIINIVLSKHYVDKIIREDLTKQGIKIGEETKIEIV
jgi:hypothetical protein